MTEYDIISAQEYTMIYKNFQDMKLSALGFGTMRLPVIDGDVSRIDEKASEMMVDHAMAHGVNYYDTAWGYHNGNSELVIGRLLKKYDRSSFYLASKFPGYDLRNMDKVEEIFEKQLKKCQVEYFDFYMFHNVCEMNIDEYLDRKHGIFDYLVRQKKAGRIKHLGFSAHGSCQVMERFMEAYGSEMEFCQIQLNYIDWKFQNAEGKIKLLNRYGLPVWVMEPVRGGKLARLSDEDMTRLKALDADETAAGWAFRFIQSVPEVKVTLSGMSDMAQLEENIKIFEHDKPVSQKGYALLTDIADRMIKKTSVPCTGCHYCTEHCPKGIDIPRLIELYNEDAFNKGGFLPIIGLQAIPEGKRPDSCMKCHSCEAVCPQNIKISDVLAAFAERMKRKKK